jgi:hypothetical protein
VGGLSVPGTRLRTFVFPLTQVKLHRGPRLA